MQKSMGHDIIVEELENHLSGGASPAFYDHLRICPDCRTQVAEIGGLTSFLSELKSAEDSAPPVPPGFYNRVATGIREQQGVSPWDLFSNSALFFRRVAFAALILLAVMGGVLATRDMEGPDAGDVTAIMARHDAFAAHEEAADRDHLLVTLVSYGR
jgi:predicted anti-sigma-YlaC factor YlaD